MKTDAGIYTHTGLIKLVGIMLMMGLFCSAQAKEITQLYNNLTINANLEMAEGKDFNDGIVLVLHGMMAHNKMELMESIQQALHDNNHSSLAINLSLNRDNRHGFFDCAWPHKHIQDNVFDELNAWVDWLRKKGTDNITLLSHSRGANQAMVYVAEHRPPEVKHLAMLSPGVDDLNKTYENRYGEKLDTYLLLMNQRIAAGKGDEPVEKIDFWYCPQATVSPNSYISYYGEQSKFKQFLTIMPKITIPTIVITGTVDEVMPYVSKVVTPMVDNKRIFLTKIEGAGHFFRDFNIEEAMEAALVFLDETK